MMIRYTDSLDGVSAENLQGFFVGWPNPPIPQTHLRILEGSDRCILAIDTETQNVIGFITAITDGVLSAYIPLLEVLPDYQGQGIGQTLVQRILEDLKEMYMIDLLCDSELKSFYERFEMMPAVGMMKRNYSQQSGS